jgi:hypothetical protein
MHRERGLHLHRGEDPDDPQNVLEDVGNAFRDAMAMIQQRADEMGVDISNLDEVEVNEPPEPNEFALHRRVSKWSDAIEGVFVEAEEKGSFWLYTEAAEDVAWYKNTLCAKTYRQLCNRWHVEQGEEFSEHDYDYTRTVLQECCSLLSKALAEIGSSDDPSRLALATLALRLGRLEKDLLEI